jgi:ABC-type transport system involved in cytochrome c biogenesis permease subunit
MLSVMRPALFVFEVLLPVLYFSTVWVYARSFYSGIKTAERMRMPLLSLTLILHGCYLAFRTLTFGHPPITGLFEIWSVIAFMVAITYAFVEIRTGDGSTGYFILMFPFFFQLGSSVFIKESSSASPFLQSTLFGIHVSSALLGMASITISAVYGFLYLMLYHDIKSRQFSVIYKRLPTLESLERMNSAATSFGFAFLTIAIVMGFLWIPQSGANVSYTDPKLLGTLAVWLIYALGIGARSFIGWHGRKFILVSICGFALALFSLTAVNIFFSGFHKFY